MFVAVFPGVYVVNGYWGAVARGDIPLWGSISSVQCLRERWHCCWVICRLRLRLCCCWCPQDLSSSGSGDAPLEFPSYCHGNHGLPLRRISFCSWQYRAYTSYCHGCLSSFPFPSSWHKRIFGPLDSSSASSWPWNWARCRLCNLVEREVIVGLLRRACLNVFLSAYWPCLGSSLSRNVSSDLLAMTLGCWSCWFSFIWGLLLVPPSVPASRAFRSCYGLGPCCLGIVDDNPGSFGWILFGGGHHLETIIRGSWDIIQSRH